MVNFSIVAAWRETLRLTRRDMATYLTLAAAFVLLPIMAVEVFGPPQPARLSEVSGNFVIFQGVLALIGALAQLGVARMAITGQPARQALAYALTALPRLVAVAFLTALALLPAVLLIRIALGGVQAAALPGLILLIPGIYVAARLALAMPSVAARDIGPIAALRQSWMATTGNGWRVLAFMALMVLVLIGLTILAGGIGAALGSVLTLLGGKLVAEFVVALISAAVATLYAVYNSVGLAVLYRRLVV